MNNIICKENENKVMEILTSDFNAMLKEYGIEWEVVENSYMPLCRYIQRIIQKSMSHLSMLCLNSLILN